MLITETKIEGAFAVTPQQHHDERGVFLEWFRADLFEKATGHPFTIAQANCSVSAAGTIRGIHYAEVPPSQAKYVTCPAGALVDVVVDLRVGSPTFGQFEMVRLDDENRAAVYVAEGLGHAFMALEDRTVIQYLCSAPYAPGREHGVHPLDPTLSIPWPLSGRDGKPVDPLLSEKDRSAPTLVEAQERRLLPSYDEALAYVASLGG